MIRYGKDVNIKDLHGVRLEVRFPNDLRGHWRIGGFVPQPQEAPKQRPKPVPIKRTPWEILGVTPKTDREAIKRAYRRLARMYHPDLNRTRDTTAQMQMVNEAYQAILRELGEA